MTSVWKEDPLSPQSSGDTTAADAVAGTPVASLRAERTREGRVNPDPFIASGGKTWRMLGAVTSASRTIST